MRRPDPAETVVLLGAGVLAGGDVWLHRTDRRLVTDVLRTPLALCALLYLVAHVVDVLGPLDLFRLAGRLIRRRKR